MSSGNLGQGGAAGCGPLTELVGTHTHIHVGRFFLKNTLIIEEEGIRLHQQFFEFYCDFDTAVIGSSALLRPSTAVFITSIIVVVVVIIIVLLSTSLK